jgi:FlaA1/EpsC-like NDP-sugar epimerase
MSNSAVSPVARLAEFLIALPRPVKRSVMIAADAIMLPASLWMALVLKFDRLPLDPARYGAVFAVAVGVALAIFSALGLYRTVIRFMGPKAVATVVGGVSLSVLALGVWDRLGALTRLPLSVLVIYWALALLYVAGSRSIVRYVFFYGRKAGDVRRVIIYGAGDAGARLCSVLLGGPDFAPVAFVDDKASVQGSHINGIKVFSPAALQELIRIQDVDRVLLAIPSASRRRRREILDRLAGLGIHVQSLPDLSDIIAGKAKIDELREVDVADLLGRDPVPPQPSLYAACVSGKSVLVTGAGGSIGTELCRQILRLSPRRLVLCEMSEFALYTIERELRAAALKEGISAELVPLLGNVHHRHRLVEVLQMFEVQTLYHAAAYKHLPIVEYNVIEGIHNNVIGTWYAAEAALEASVETFVLVSTDKAVKPTNVMGATKRLAELVVQSLQERSTFTRFCIVRFGNVLGSSGSVLPLFEEQIRCGGPVTVTHPDVIRYFMTIPEAAQLVIQAGAMAKGGDVFVLNMGQPVRIDDLAKRLIKLMGLVLRDTAHPDGDIEIQYIGLRPAEKLFEELLLGTNVAGTEHPMILSAVEDSLAWERMRPILDDLLSALGSFDCSRAITILSDAVAEYRRAPEIRDYVWARKATSATGSRKIAELAAKRRQVEVAPPAGLGNV